MRDIDEGGSVQFRLKSWAWLLPFVKPVQGRLIFVIALMAVSAAVDACIPLFTKYAVDSFVVPRSTAGLGGFSLFYVAVIVFQSFTTLLFCRQCMVIEMHTGRRMKRACFTHLQKLPLSFYNSTSVGYLLSRVMSDTNKLSGILSWGAIHFIWNALYLIFILVAMFIINVRMALWVLCVIPFILAATVIFSPRLLNANRVVRRTNSRITGSFNENINGAKTSKTLNIEERNCAEFESVTGEMHSASVRAARLSAVYMPLISFFGALAVAVVLVRGGGHVAARVMEYGVLSAFISYGISILEPISQMASMFSELMGAQVNSERVSALLSQPVTIGDSAEIEAEFGGIFDPKPENWPPLKGDVRFEHVWFRYPDAHEDDWVLTDVDLNIPAGSTVAIVGETGAGKSTMVNLVCRFFEPTKGRILIDGVDYKERGQLWLRSNLGYVQQTPHLFSGTLLDNIRYGRLDATDGEIKAAAALVSADRVAERLEDGWDTDVGEGGDRLSTGEKQLISFARAVVADPPIFVLDEATSSIDTETEKLIQDAISHVLQGRTSFIIAHRLSTIRSADVILLVDAHGIAEMGSHDELMALRGQYYELYTAMMVRDVLDGEA